MIRLLTQQDHDIVRSYLGNDPLNNVYLIHGLETQDLEGRRVRLWGAFDYGRLEGVLFVNDAGRGYLSGDNPGVLAQLGKFAWKVGVDSLLGKSIYVQPAVAALENLYPRLRVRRTHGHLCEVHPGQAVCHYDYPVRAATKDDVPLLVELYEREEPGRGCAEELECKILEAIDNSACFFIEVGGRAVSVARIEPETEQAGVIESARTLSEFRGRGMYPSIRTACVEYLFSKDKVALGIIKDANTPMHKIVEKCGGSLTAPWLYARFRKEPPLGQRIFPVRLRRWASRMKARALHH